MKRVSMWRLIYLMLCALMLTASLLLNMAQATAPMSVAVTLDKKRLIKRQRITANVE